MGMDGLDGHAIRPAMVLDAATVIPMVIGTSAVSAVCAAVDETDAVARDVEFEGTVVSRAHTSVTFHGATLYKGDAFVTDTLPATAFADGPLAYLDVGAHDLVLLSSGFIRGR
jgi:hypothetical protein